MTGALAISVEPLSDEVLSVYRDPQLLRGANGRDAVAWTFDGNPTPFCVARLDGRIVGISAYVRTAMKFGAETGIALQAVDSFMEPEMRGRGVFPMLAKAYAEHAKAAGADLIWGFPNDAAAPIWFNKLGWANLGQAPFMIRPLRGGYFLRKLGIPGDFPLPVGKDQNIAPLEAVGDWVDGVWDKYAAAIGCATNRDSEYLQHRLFRGPFAKNYRVVSDPLRSTIVATREAEKHGGRIAYLMEAMGGAGLSGVVRSELARLRDRGVELALAWSYPWSPNYRAIRQCGFFPLSERLRPIRIWFGGAAVSRQSESSHELKNWYLSYLDSDTV